MTEEIFNDKFTLLYFGYTFCPDVCPEELEKMGKVIDEVGKNGMDLNGVFVSCDPKRDSLDSVREYLLGKFFFDYLIFHLLNAI